MNVKPGWKTTEFWVTVASQLIGILAAAGVLAPDDAETWMKIATQAGGLAAMVLSAIGYSASRGKAKQIGGAGGAAGQGGFATIRALMVLALVGFVAVFFFGCMQTIWNPTGKSVCDDPECAQGSLICKVTAERETTPEALNGILLDGAALDVVFQPQNRDDICGYLADLKIIYNPQMLWADLIQFTELSAEQSAALAAVIQRRIPLAELAVNRFISECDDKMLRAGWTDHWEQLNCDAVQLE